MVNKMYRIGNPYLLLRNLTLAYANHFSFFFKGLKLVVQTLLSSLKPISNIVVICCAFFLIFGILGVQLFKGYLTELQKKDSNIYS